MTKLLAVPMHVDALVLRQPREVAGPGLDITRAPWFGPGLDGTVRDHFPEVANVAGAIRHDPMAPSNRFLQPGIHLHWSLPDALCHGTTADPQSAAYVHRDGLWFPAVPNRWLVLRRPGLGAIIDGAWLIESDATHAWGHGTEAAAYPVQPTEAWPHPFVRLGRRVDLLAGVGAHSPGPALADLDAPLTAVGQTDPSFAALYTAAHSVFGMHDPAPPSTAQQWEVFGWYGEGATDPLADWLRLPGETKEALADLLSQLGAPVAADDLGPVKAARAKARLAILQDRQRWALPEGQGDAFGGLKGLVLYGAVTVDGAKAEARPPAVEATAAIGLSPREALAALVAAKRRVPGLEGELEAVAFADDLKDHALDLGPKLAEHRHTAGFAQARSTVLWSLRPAADPSHPLDEQRQRRRRRDVAIPGVLGHLLNHLNAAEEALGTAEATLDARRQDLFADWQVYMMAAYPEDDRADFALDVDLLRDGLLPRSMADCQAAEEAVHAAGLTRDARHGALADALAEWNVTKPPHDHLALEPGPGPRYWRPADPSIALDGAAALAPTRRHGRDGRARDDGLMECVAVDMPAFPGASRRADPDRLDGFSQAIAQAATDGFRAIAEQSQEAGAWNAILIEWEAMLHPAADGTNLRASDRRFDPEVLDRHYLLGEQAVDLAAKGADHYDGLETGHRVSGRSILTRHGPEMLTEALEAYLGDLDRALGDARDEKRGNQSAQSRLDNPVEGHRAPHDARDAAQASGLLQARAQALDEADKVLRPLKRRLAPVLQDMQGKASATGEASIVTFTLGGLIERLLMQRLEPQLPIADPIGFAADQARAAEVRRLTGPAARLASPDPGAPFLPLAGIRIDVLPGRVIDSFGQFTEWRPRPKTRAASANVIAAETIRDVAGRPVLPPRIAQGARLDFRWLAARGDEVEANDHPATTPLCGWLIPNDFDQNVLVYAADGRLLGMVDLRGTWRPAPGDPAAPAGPGLIGNPHLARLAGWLTTRGEDGFTGRFLSTLDSALSAIDPTDHATHGARALLAGRPVAVARARVGVSLLGAPAKDRSGATYQRRLSGFAASDHGFGAVRVPVRIGEHRQLNDGLVGYFADDGGPLGVLSAPQSAPGARDRSAHIEIYDEDRGTPLTLWQALSGPPQDLLLLLDPRCPVHATCGVLPTKAVTLPRRHFEPGLDALELVFSGMPVMSPSDHVQLPLPDEPGHRWSWLQLQDGRWQETPAAGRLTPEMLARALPGAVAVAPDGTVSDLAPGRPAPSGAARRAKADLLWERLVTHGWLALEDGPALAGRLRVPETPDLGAGFDPAAIARLLAKIAGAIEPAERHAVFGPRLVAREGWLKLTPASPKPVHPDLPRTVPEPVPPESS